MPTCDGPGALAGAHGAGAFVAGQRRSPNITAAHEALADLRFRRDVARLHRLGPRVLFELFIALGARRLIRTEIEQLVGQYASLDREMIRAVGADRLPPLPPPRLVVKP